jgi:hypothetical protein
MYSENFREPPESPWRITPQVSIPVREDRHSLWTASREYARWEVGVSDEGLKHNSNDSKIHSDNKNPLAE